MEPETALELSNNLDPQASTPDVTMSLAETAVEYSVGMDPQPSRAELVPDPVNITQHHVIEVDEVGLRSETANSAGKEATSRHNADQQHSYSGPNLHLPTTKTAK